MKSGRFHDVDLGAGKRPLAGTVCPERRAARTPLTSRLPVRACHVVGADTVETHQVVQCPQRQQSTLLARCCSCAHLGSISASTGGPERFVLCEAAEPGLPHGRVDVAEAAVRVRLGDVIGVETTCVRSDLKVGSVTDLLLTRGLRAVAVVDAHRRLLGVVTKANVLRGARKGRIRPKTAADVMTPLAQGLPDDAPVAHAISLMASEDRHEVPIVDSNGLVVGMITSTDALRWIAQALGYVVSADSVAPPQTAE